MNTNRYTLQRDGSGTWSVLDMETAHPAIARDRILISMSKGEAEDAAAMLNMIDDWRREKPGPAPDLSIGRALVSFLHQP